MPKKRPHKKRAPPKTAFKEGTPRPEGAGRKPGVKNKTTRMLRDAFVLAAELAGDSIMDGYYGNKQQTKHLKESGLVGYLHIMALEFPSSFLPQLGRVMPVQVEAQVMGTVVVKYKTPEEVRAEMAKRGIPVDKIGEVFKLKYHREEDEKTIDGEVKRLEAAE